MSLQAGVGTHFCLSCLWPKKNPRSWRSELCRSCARSRSLMGHSVSIETRSKLRIAGTGRRHSLKTKEKIRASLMGRSLSREALIKLRMVAQSPEHRKKVSLGNKKRFSRQDEIDKISGTNSCHWRGGIPKPYASEFTKELKETIRKRDDYLCQNPNCYLPENGKVHDVHHIDDNRFNNNLVNLITLCRKCHSKSTNGNMNYWQEYYQNLQEIRGIK